MHVFRIVVKAHYVSLNFVFNMVWQLSSLLKLSLYGAWYRLTKGHTQDLNLTHKFKA